MQSKHAYASKQTSLQGGEREAGTWWDRQDERVPIQNPQRSDAIPPQPQQKKNGKKSEIASEKARGKRKKSWEKDRRGEVGESWKEREGGAASTVAAAALQREWRSRGSWEM